MFNGSGPSECFDGLNSKQMHYFMIFWENESMLRDTESRPHQRRNQTLNNIVRN